MLLVNRKVQIPIFQTERAISDSPVLSVVVPTRNEAENIDKLIIGIKKAFCDTYAEVIFVDDSSDNTPKVVQAAEGRFHDLDIRLIHRKPGKRIGGLGGAVVEGLKAARAEYACIMDGDLQHPPELVPILLNKAREKQTDIVIATRRGKGSELAGLNIVRDLISRGLDLLGRILFPKQLHGISDPLTGFFLVRINALRLAAFRPNGFKILLEILVRHPDLSKEEVPFHFGERFAGHSKASATEVWRYLNLLWMLRFGQDALRFIKFVLVGASGILVNSLVLFLTTEKYHVYYLLSAGISTIASTLWNFGLTEAWVYRSQYTSQGRAKRLGMFFTMNLFALSLRTPMIYLFTSVLGVYYVFSNLVSLAMLTVVRFIFSDSIIWKQSSLNQESSEPRFRWTRRIKILNKDARGTL